MTVLRGMAVELRPPTEGDIAELARIRAEPEVYAHWRGGADLVAAVREDLVEAGSTPYVIEYDGRVVGWIQWQAEEDRDYRHASIDLYLDPAVRGQGLGPDALRALARHLFEDHGHHRLTIDPAVANPAAIAAYRKVGFRPVGVLRQAERDVDGTWRDALLMDLLRDEFTDD